MPASGKAITGKKGTITITNETGATPTFTVAAEVQDFKLNEEAAEVTGARLSGPDFIETDEPLWRGEFTLYISKSDVGVAFPFKTGDRVNISANFGGNTAVGHVRILKRGEISVAKGNFLTCPVSFAQSDDAFAVTMKLITVA